MIGRSLLRMGALPLDAQILLFDQRPQLGLWSAHGRSIGGRDGSGLAPGHQGGDAGIEDEPPPG